MHVDDSFEWSSGRWVSNDLRWVGGRTHGNAVYNWKPVVGDNLLGIGIGRGCGTLKGFTSLELRAFFVEGQKISWNLCGIVFPVAKGQTCHVRRRTAERLELSSSRM